jgi:hypothetical protein
MTSAAIPFSTGFEQSNDLSVMAFRGSFSIRNIVVLADQAVLLALLAQCLRHHGGAARNLPAVARIAVAQFGDVACTRGALTARSAGASRACIPANEFGQSEQHRLESVTMGLPQRFYLRAFDMAQQVESESRYNAKCR